MQHTTDLRIEITWWTLISLHDQIPKETRTKRNMPPIIKARKQTYRKNYTNSEKKKQSISPKIQWEDGYHCLATFLQNSAQSLSKSNATRERNKTDLSS